jgi:hypothetical protein
LAVVNLYVDHMMYPPPQSAEDVWNATHERSQEFTTAARAIGLTPAEYQEFRNDLLDGKAFYVRLPRRLDAMAGYRNGQVYVVRRVVIETPNVMGWEVVLGDGARVYVPQLCGNLSLLRVPPPRPPLPPPYHEPRPAPVATPTPTPVIIQPTAPPVVPPAPVAPAVSEVHNAPWWLIFLPIAGGFTGGGGGTPPPPCNQGSNVFGACQGSSK